MAQYKVLQRVEIGGVTREIGQELDESCFNPAPPVTEQQKLDDPTLVAHLSEAESLLATGHIVVI